MLLVGVREVLADSDGVSELDGVGKGLVVLEPVCDPSTDSVGELLNDAVWLEDADCEALTVGDADKEGDGGPVGDISELPVADTLASTDGVAELEAATEDDGELLPDKLSVALADDDAVSDEDGDSEMETEDDGVPDVDSVIDGEAVKLGVTLELGV